MKNKTSIQVQCGGLYVQTDLDYLTDCIYNSNMEVEKIETDNSNEYLLLVTGEHQTLELIVRRLQ